MAARSALLVGIMALLGVRAARRIAKSVDLEVHAEIQYC